MKTKLGVEPRDASARFVALPQPVPVTGAPAVMGGYGYDSLRFFRARFLGRSRRQPEITSDNGYYVN